MDNVSFAIMEEKQFFACNGPLDGILGVSYWEGNDAVPVNSSDFEASSVWVESCKKPDQYEFSVGGTSRLETVTLRIRQLFPPHLRRH